MRRVLLKIISIGLRFGNWLANKLSNEYINHFRKIWYQLRFDSNDALVGNGVIMGGAFTITDFRSITIGENVVLGEKFYAESEGGIVIGDNCLVGRNLSLYTILDDTRSNEKFAPIYIGKNVVIGKDVIILPGTKIYDNTNIKSGRTLQGVYGDSSCNHNLSDQRDIFFVLSTGRSGSASIATFLSQHPELRCLHEPRNHLIRLSTDYEYGYLTFEEVVDELRFIYCKANVYGSGIYGESHQKLSNLILPLHTVMPQAKFIWLYRDIKKVVKSMYDREWYLRDKTFTHKYRGPNKQGWEGYRLHASKCNLDISIDWHGMTRVEKLSWYWYYWNLKIIKDLEELNQIDYFKLNLRDLSVRTTELQEFLQVQNQIPMKKVHANKAKKVHKGNSVLELTIPEEKIMSKYVLDLEKYF